MSHWCPTGPHRRPTCCGKATDEVRQGSRAEPWPTSHTGRYAKIERLRRVLRDEVLTGATEGLTMLRSLPHGHVAAVLGIARKIGLDRLLAAGQAPARLAALVLAMVLARVIDPASKLATAQTNSTPRQRPPRSARCWNWGRSASRNCMPRSTGCSASNHASRADLRIANLSKGTLVHYVVSSTYAEGRTCPLATARGYSRDGETRQDEDHIRPAVRQ